MAGGGLKWERYNRRVSAAKSGTKRASAFASKDGEKRRGLGYRILPLGSEEFDQRKLYRRAARMRRRRFLIEHRWLKMKAGGEMV